MVMKGRPLAKAGYEQELTSIKGFIAMQNKAARPVSLTPADKVTSICWWALIRTAYYCCSFG